MRKKILIFGVMIFLMILIVISCNTAKDDDLTDFSPEQVAEKLISDIFTLSYDDAIEEYEYKFKESASEDDVDRPDYIYRDDIFRKYFLEESYESFYYSIYNLIHHTYVREHEFNIMVKSIDLDMRDTSDDDTKACYFTVEYELVFIDEKKESIDMSTDREMSLKKESNIWLVNFIGLKVKQLSID